MPGRLDFIRNQPHNVFWSTTFTTNLTVFETAIGEIYCKTGHALERMFLAVYMLAVLHVIR